MERISCPHAAQCAGCPAIALAYDAQLERKQARVRRSVARHGSLADVEVGPTLGAEAVVGYRVRAKLVVAPGPRLGLYGQGGGHDVVDIPACRVLRPALAETARVLRALMANPPADAAAALTPASKVRGGALRAVDLREALGEDGAAHVVLTLVVDRAARVGQEALRAAARHIVELAPAVVTVAASSQAGQSPQLLGDAPVVVWGQDMIRDQVGSGFVLASPGSFVQAHRGQAARIHEQVAQELERALGSVAGKRIVDVYAGSGGIGLGLAARGARVTLIESFAPAAAAAERAARAQRLKVETTAGDAAAELGALLRGGKRIDAIVLNPPRRGVAPAVRLACAELAPEALVYVSCEPDTLCRDLADLARLGLRTSALTPYDMMPLTDEVETVAVLRPGAALAPALLLDEAQLVAVDKPGHEPTVAERGGRQSLLGRLQALPGLAAAVPLARVEASVSGVCLFARSAEAAARSAKVLRTPESRREYLALCRGIIRPKGTIGGHSHGEARGDERAKEARTRYRRLEVVGGHSLVRVTVEHGRVEQLRRHLGSIGHPVLGDVRYGHAPSNRHMSEKHGLDRPFLHCARMVLPHPASERLLELESPLAGDLQMVLDRLQGAELETSQREARADAPELD